MSSIYKAFSNETVISYLPDGVDDWDFSSIIDQYQEYFQFDLELNKGSTIFDIGANIGIFSLAIYDYCKKNARIYAFEPIPAILEMLKKNIEPYKSKDFIIIPYGISNKSDFISFTYYPNAPCLSTYKPEHIQLELKQLINSDRDLLPDIINNKNTINKKPDRFARINKILGLKTLFHEDTIQCEVKKLSTVIKEYHIQQIDLLKVDVNGSELDILSGIEDNDWRKIKQIIVKIPVGSDKLSSLKELLHKYGYNNLQIINHKADINSISYYLAYAKL